jgi:hypothetical protein
LGNTPFRRDPYLAPQLEAALWAFDRSDSFREGALLAVDFGSDADTTGTIYGQMAELLRLCVRFFFWRIGFRSKPSTMLAPPSVFSEAPDQRFKRFSKRPLAALTAAEQLKYAANGRNGLTVLIRTLPHQDWQALNTSLNFRHPELSSAPQISKQKS